MSNNSNNNNFWQKSNYNKGGSSYVVETPQQSFEYQPNQSYAPVGSGKHFSNRPDNRLSNPMMLSIPNCTVENSLEGKFALFSILVQKGYVKFEVRRRYRNFMALHQEVCTQFPDIAVPEFPEQKTTYDLMDTSSLEWVRTSLETYLRKLAQVPEVWTCPMFIEFLENSLTSYDIQVQVNKMIDEINYLRHNNEMLSGHILKCNIRLNDTGGILNELQNRIAALEAEKYGMREATPKSIKELNQASFTQNFAKQENSGSWFDEPYKQLDDKMWQQPITANGSETNSSQNFANLSEEASWLGAVSNSPLQIGEVDLQPPLPFPADENSELKLAIIPQQDSSSIVDGVIDSLIQLFHPLESQAKFRTGVESYLLKLSRKSMGAQINEIGFQSLRCFLPDDDITLCIFVSRGLETCWFNRLIEKLSRVAASSTAENAAGYSDSDFGSRKEVNVLDMECFDGSSISSLSIQNFIQMLENGDYKLLATLGKLNVEIKSNTKIELCMMAFIEDFDRVVGKNHLFKRSLLLVRAWWQTDGIASSGGLLTPIVLNNNCFATMMVHIFQVHSSRIHYPFQALCLFISVFCCFDWGKYGLTFYGPVRLGIKSNLIEVGDGIMTSDTIIQYQKIAKLPTNTAAHGIAQQSEGKKVIYDSLNIRNSEQTSSAMFIFHPLIQGYNLVPTSVNEQVLGVITQVLQSAAVKFSEALRLLEENESNNAEEILKHGLFRECFKKYEDYTRPDTFEAFTPDSETDTPIPSAQPTSPVAYVSKAAELEKLENKDPPSTSSPLCNLTCSLDHIWELIRYCNVISEAEVSEAQIRQLSRDVLLERGPLPVGEIGKMLQETTGISTLSAVMKEKYGGLKKFLENIPDEFLIATDHPFNPHVVLVETLTKDDMRHISQGHVPHHILNKKKNAVKTRRKEVSQQQFNVTAPIQISPVNASRMSAAFFGNRNNMSNSVSYASVVTKKGGDDILNMNPQTTTQRFTSFNPSQNPTFPGRNQLMNTPQFGNLSKF